MAITLEAHHGSSHPECRGLQALWLIAASLLTLFVLGVDAMAQDSAQPTPTPHWITAPSLPVRGPIISHTPIPPGAMVPTPGMISPPEHPVGISIDTYVFQMRRGPCAFRVRAAIDSDKDLLTGDEACDSLIRQARTIQRQKEAEDPSYARAMHATPVPTSDLSGDDETH